MTRMNAGEDRDRDAEKMMDGWRKKRVAGGQ